jgi:hypothetical protein
MSPVYNRARFRVSDTRSDEEGGSGDELEGTSRQDNESVANSAIPASSPSYPRYGNSVEDEGEDEVDIDDDNEDEDANENDGGEAEEENDEEDEIVSVSLLTLLVLLILCQQPVLRGRLMKSQLCLKAQIHPCPSSPV